VSTAAVVCFFTLPLSSALTTTTSLTLVAGLSTVTVLVVWQVRSILRSPHPRARAVAAIVTTVPLFLVVFATAHYAMSRSAPESFSEPLSRLDAAYFTMTVFATVGFGDITPTSTAARIATTLQMLGDVIVVGFVVQVIAGAMRQGIKRRAAESADESTTP
jgi:voltage-gated potassium channel